MFLSVETSVLRLCAGFLMVSFFMALGVAFTALGKKFVAADYQAVGAVALSTSRPAESEFGEVKRRILQVSVRVHFLAVCGMLSFCLRRGSFSSQYGAAWELWLVWLAACLTQGLVEIVVVSRRGERRALSVYPVKMIIGHMPFLSEKVDTAKDIMFCALAWHAGDVYLAGFSLAMLVLCHELFLQSKEVEADLYEAYLPILSATPPDAEVSGQSASKSQPPSSQALETLLKKTSAGVRRIAMMENLPQAMLAILYVSRNGDCAYVSGSFIVSLVGILPSLPAVARAVNRWAIDKIHSDLVNSARDGNAARLYGQLTRLKHTEKTESPLDVTRFTMAEKLWLLMASLLIGYLTYSSMDNTHHIIVGVLTVVGVMVMLCIACCAAGTMNAKSADSLEGYVEYGIWTVVVLCVGIVFVIVSTAMSLMMHSLLPLKAYCLGFVVALILTDFLVWTPLRIADKWSESDARLSRDKVDPADLVLMVCLLKELQCTLSELKAFGFGLVELKEAGYGSESLPNLLVAGFTAKDGKKAGFGLSQLKEAGYGDSDQSLKDLKAAGFTAKEFKKAGFSKSHMEKAGFGWAERNVAGMV
eukprot:TRINITY_DN34407_c0_g1_i1.p1 TRINITY_DN34407_c0_g1~~TRINITY_DN34407_c0_g1_i1.p1  ORF type:complete len:588 (+),score=57.38 TRINITY_DN34407_c0_g1_i1:226-1989(+)